MPVSYEKVMHYLFEHDYFPGVGEDKKAPDIEEIYSAITRLFIDLKLISAEEAIELKIKFIRLLATDTVWPLVVNKIITNEHIKKWGWDKFFNILTLLNHLKISPFILSGELTFEQVVLLREQISHDKDLYIKARANFADIIKALNHPRVRALLIGKFITLADVIDLGVRDIIRLAEVLSRHEMEKAIKDVKTGKKTVAEIVFFDPDLSDDEGADLCVEAVVWCCLFCCRRRPPRVVEQPDTATAKKLT